MLESLEVLNERLLNTYGKFEHKAKYQIVFSETEYEIRKTNYSHEGLLLANPVYEKLPKYKQWIHNKYVLEILLPVPDLNREELTGKLTYEPIWIFEDKNGNPLPPKWEVCQFVIQQLLRQSAQAVGRKYYDPDGESLEEAIDARERRLENLQQDLFGNESNIGDALAYKQGVSVPTNYKGESDVNFSIESTKNS